MPVQKFRKKPVVIEAIQFLGDNWIEVQAFTQTHTPDGEPEHLIQNFNEIGTYLVPVADAPHTAELWVAANSQWLPVQPYEWILKDASGFYPCQPDRFLETYERAAPEVEIGTEDLRFGDGA